MGGHEKVHECWMLFFARWVSIGRDGCLAAALRWCSYVYTVEWLLWSIWVITGVYKVVSMVIQCGCRNILHDW